MSLQDVFQALQLSEGPTDANNSLPMDVPLSKRVKGDMLMVGAQEDEIEREILSRSPCRSPEQREFAEFVNRFRPVPARRHVYCSSSEEEDSDYETIEDARFVNNEEPNVSAQEATSPRPDDTALSAFISKFRPLPMPLGGEPDDAEDNVDTDIGSFVEENNRRERAEPDADKTGPTADDQQEDVPNPALSEFIGRFRQLPKPKSPECSAEYSASEEEPTESISQFISRFRPLPNKLVSPEYSSESECEAEADTVDVHG